EAKSSPWLTAVFVEKPESHVQSKGKAEAKKQLVKHLKEQMGVQSVQVGRYTLKLSENIPAEVLKEACHDLLYLYREDKSLGEVTTNLENAFNAWLMTNRKSA